MSYFSFFLLHLYNGLYSIISLSRHHPQNIPQRDMELEFDEGPKEGGGEQGRWEEARVATATLQFGAKEERERRIKEEKEKYQLVLEEDEMINFVSTAITMKGTLSEKVGT